MIPRPSLTRSLITAVAVLAGLASSAHAQSRFGSREPLELIEVSRDLRVQYGLNGPMTLLDLSAGPIEAGDLEPPPEDQYILATIPSGDFGGGNLAPANGDVLSGTYTNVGTFTIGAGTTVFVANGVPLVVMADTIVINGTLDANGKGFAGGTTSPNPSQVGGVGQGPGGGSGGLFGNCVHSNGGGGGGYGGNGGASGSLFGSSPPPNPGGGTYGVPNPPGIEMGSGGGAGGNHCNTTRGTAGGAGGGAISLFACELIVGPSGLVTANGDNGVTNPVVGGASGGAGSGGGIEICALTGQNSGILRAQGGNGGNGAQGFGFGMGGGGGAGGRIKISSSVTPGTALANGGVGGTGSAIGGSIQAQPGTAGTIVTNGTAECTGLSCASGECDLSPIEAKLDDSTRFTSDVERNTQTTTLVSEINANESKLNSLEAKLDDGTRFTSDAERTSQTTTLTTEINQNETKLNSLEAKLDDGTRFTSDAENNAQTATLTTEINQNQAEIARLEVKLDDGTRFTSDTERATQTSTLTTEINQNEVKVDRVEAKLDDETRFTDDSELGVVRQEVAALEVKMDALAILPDLLEEQLRIETEHALGEDVNINKPMVIFMLPAANNGRLESVRDLVRQRITDVEAAGCNSGNALAEWNAGNDEYDLGHWNLAWTNYARSYQELPMGPCN